MNGDAVELGEVRWLAGKCGLAVDELPEPVLVSTLLHHGKATPALDAYLTWWLGHSDPDSNFERKTRWLRWMPARVVLRIMIWLGYDGLLYRSEDEIVGHVFFQQHGTSLCAFSLALAGKLQGRGLSSVLMLDFVAHAGSLGGIMRAHIGTGRNRVTNRAREILRASETHLPLHVTPDGWIAFER